MSTEEKNPMQSTKVVTGEVRFSYANVFEAKSINGGDAKYSVVLLIPKSDTATVSKIEKAIENAKELGKSKWGGKVPKGIKTPLRDGDEERDGEEYEGCYFINASSKTKPGVINKKREKITDEEEFYSGCYGLASVTFYAFDASGNKGIACGLNNLLKTKEGEPLGGRQTAESDFAEYTEEDDFM